uniref:Ankyrin repeat domain-containing protein 39 n=1 Tax=Cyanoderma ruficeps TaxID=181631 RepID=A0A8C3X8H3_9PASS
MAGGPRSPPAPCCPGRGAMAAPCCPGRVAVPSVHQSLSEMDFERGIWAAARDGDEARVLQLLERRGDPAELDLAGYTALVRGNGGPGGPHLAGCTAPVRGNGGPGGPHLHYASRNGHLGVCRLLLERGAPCDARTPGGATPLHRAAEQGHRELCALLLRHRPALAALRDARGRTPRDGAHPAVRDLLDA